MKQKILFIIKKTHFSRFREKWRRWAGIQENRSEIQPFYIRSDTKFNIRQINNRILGWMTGIRQDVILSIWPDVKSSIQPDIRYFVKRFLKISIRGTEPRTPGYGVVPAVAVPHIVSIHPSSSVWRRQLLLAPVI